MIELHSDTGSTLGWLKGETKEEADKKRESKGKKREAKKKTLRGDTFILLVCVCMSADFVCNCNSPAQETF